MRRNHSTITELRREVRSLKIELSDANKRAEKHKTSLKNSRLDFEKSKVDLELKILNRDSKERFAKSLLQEMEDGEIDDYG